jgi:hypothetical protein
MLAMWEGNVFMALKNLVAAEGGWSKACPCYFALLFSFSFGKDGRNEERLLGRGCIESS